MPLNPTSDANSDRTFQNLKKRFKTWDEVLATDENEIADVIRLGGARARDAGRGAPRDRAADREVLRETELDFRIHRGRADRVRIACCAEAIVDGRPQRGALAASEAAAISAGVLPADGSAART